MYEMVQAILTSGEKTDLRQLLGELRSEESVTPPVNEILQAFETTAINPKSQPFTTLLLGRPFNCTHEILLEEESIWFLVRARIAKKFCGLGQI